MSAAEKEIPAETRPPAETEVERTRREDPAFAVDLARAIAKARGVDYDPKRHGPFDTKPVPRNRPAERPATTDDKPLAELAERFMAKGARPPNRYLKEVR